MIEEGEGAPGFELPAVVGGEIERVGLADYLGSNVIVLAFYPADFNPACDGTKTDLDELDLFTMQKDVTVLGVSGDSVYSHRAFADEYDLKVPLLADVHGSVAEDYGVAVSDPEAGHRTRRAVAVIGPGGDVEFAWSTDDLRELPPVDRVREAVDDVGGSETAVARYRVGHAHYVEGRRAFTSAMNGFGDEEWMMAQSDFRRAFEEFEEAQSQFNTAARFGEDEVAIAHFERAEDKAELLWQAAEWLAEAANAYASGEGAEGRSRRQDAESPLEEARRYGEPLEPDGFPAAEPPPSLEEDGEDRETVLPGDEEAADASLSVDIDEDAHADDALRASVEGQETAAGTDADDPSQEAAAGGAGGGPDGEAGSESTSAPGRPGAAGGESADPGAEAAGADGEPGEADGDGDGDEEDGIDEAELEEITAELEQQTEAAKAEREREQASEGDGGGDREEGAADAEASPADSERGEDASDGAGGDESTEDADDVELDLTDPTEGEGLDPLEDDEEEDEEVTDEELGDGGHGVPDSL